MTRFDRAALTRLEGLLREAARKDVLPHFRNLTSGDVHEKNGPLDVVTVADEAAERRITAGLHAAFPGCLVVGEEATAANPKLLDGLAEADLAFVVDPIDGTSNFADGLPLFAVMAAAIVRGELVGAAILDPIGDDIALALRGEGAWMSAADGKTTDLHAAAPAPLKKLNGSLTWRYMPPEMTAHLCTNLPKVGACWDWRCAGHQYRMIAAGRFHFMLFNRVMPWDHAPGVLLHREAGGFAARYDGTPYSPASTQGGLIVAPDQASFQAIREALIPR